MSARCAVSHMKLVDIPPPFFAFGLTLSKHTRHSEWKDVRSEHSGQETGIEEYRRREQMTQAFF